MDFAKSFAVSITWPFPHIVAALRLKGNEPPPLLKAEPILNTIDALGAGAGAAFRNFLLAVFCIYGLYPGNAYPAFGAAATFRWSWMWPIMARNLIGTWVICGFWDWWLYFGPLRQKYFKFKIIQKYPTMSQMKHDFFFTTLASGLWAWGVECLMCHWYANGVFPAWDRSLWDRPFVNLILAMGITHWRIPHFHFMHRMIHPWRTKYFPDIGRFLYRHIHSLHHKSYNITAFSGTNMHPIEATLYYTAGLVIVPLGVHPALALGCMIDCALGAWIGHDGFLWPGGGDYFHTLHHLHFDCNYGAYHVPLDWAFGTYAGSKEDVKRIWGRLPAGREANETYVHGDSQKDRVE